MHYIIFLLKDVVVNVEIDDNESEENDVLQQQYQVGGPKSV